MKLVVVGDQSTVVYVNNPITGWSSSSTHTAGQTTIISLPDNWQTASASPGAMGYHVTSNAPIYLYVHNYFHDSWDAAIVLPTIALGTNYIIQDYSTSASPFAPALALVATHDSTIVTMHLPCLVFDGTSTISGNFTRTLQAGQSLSLHGATATTFCGMTITSTQPIALFQGHSCGLVATSGGRDLMVEQARPVESWGTEFVATSTCIRTEPDLVLITSAENNCTVNINGTYVATLNRGQTHQHSLPTAAQAVYITTSKPSYVGLYPYSYNNGRTIGDPAAISINPVDHWVCNSAFGTHSFTTNQYDNSYITPNHHFLNIVTQTTATDSMLLDEVPVTGFTPMGNGYSYARFSVALGAHTLRNSQGTFTAHTYGLAPWVCYGYDVGTKIDPPTYDTIVIHDTVCQRQPYNLNGFNISVSQTANTGNLTFTTTLSAGGVMTLYILHLTILPISYQSVFDTISLSGTLTWGGMVLDAPGNYNDTLTAANGCDSIVTLHLAMRGDTILYRDTICHDEDYSGHGFSATAAELAADSYPHTFTFTRDTTVGTVTRLIMLRLTVLPTSNVSFSRSIVMGDTLHFADTVLSTAGDHIFHYTASNGCDSVVTLHLTYEGIGIKADRTGVCPGEPVVLTATGTHTLIWRSSPPSAELDGLQGQNPITVHPSVPTVYILVDAAGQEVASISVGTAPPPTLCIESNHVELDFDNPVITFHDCSEGRSSTTWTFDDGVTLHGERARRRWRQPLPDSISVTMTSCNQYNCCADTTVSLAMRIRSVWFPNVFTPNIDGENGTFRCYTSHEVAEFSITVFNRWGLELWSSEDIEQGWDGRRTDGTPCPQDAYVYRFYLRSVNGNVESGIGTVTLLR